MYTHNLCRKATLPPDFKEFLGIGLKIFPSVDPPMDGLDHSMARLCHDICIKYWLLGGGAIKFNTIQDKGSNNHNLNQEDKLYNLKI